MNLATKRGAPELFRLNHSQDDVRLQSILLPVRNADNLVFTLDFPGGFDPGLMRQALHLLYERNDCLRIHFKHKGLCIRQFFADEAAPYSIPELRFDTEDAEQAYLRRFQGTGLNLFRGETLQTVFAAHPDGTQFLLCKTTHFVADFYGIYVLVKDLKAVYDALRAGAALPPAPGRFEAVVRKDNAVKADRNLRRKNRAYFRDYLSGRQAPRPRCCTPCGPAGKRFYQPLDITHQEMITCTCPVPPDTFAAIRSFCDTNGCSRSTFLMYLSALCTSLLSGRTSHQTLLPFIDCRATVAERKCAGTKVLCPITRAEVDYDRPFRENLQRMQDDLDDLYRHLHYPFMAAEMQLHRKWCYPLASFVHSFCFSYLEQDTPQDVQFQLVPAPKGAMHFYIIARHQLADDSFSLIFHVRKKLASPEQLSRFRDLLVRVAGRVLAQPDAPLNQVLRDADQAV